MFALATPTDTRLFDVRVLSQKNVQPDEDPGGKLVLQHKLEASVLAGFDPLLQRFLFTAAQQAIAKAMGKGKGKQHELAGVDPVSNMPNLTGIGAHISVLRWVQELTGYTLTIDLGLGNKRSNIIITDCTLSKWRLTPEEGGTVLVKYDLESPHISADVWAKLAKLKSRNIMIMLTPPAVAQSSIDPAPLTPGERSEFFNSADSPFGSTDPAEAAAAGQKPKPVKPGADPVTPTDAFLAAGGAPVPL